MSSNAWKLTPDEEVKLARETLKARRRVRYWRRYSRHAPPKGRKRRELKYRLPGGPFDIVKLAHDVWGFDPKR